MEQQVKTKVQFTDDYNAFTNLENNDSLSTGFGKMHYDLGYLNSEDQRQESEINAIAQAGSKNICPIGTETHTNQIGFGTEYSFPMPEGAYIISFTGTMVAPIQFNVYSESGTRIALVDIHTIEEAESGVRFVLNDNATKCKFWYDTSDNYTLSNIMIRDANITDNTFQPYSPTNRELYDSFRELTVENASQQSEINYAVNVGAKNFCPKETETSTGSGFTSDVPVNIPAGTYILSFTGTLAHTASLSLYKALPHSGNGLGVINLSATTGAQSVEFTISETAKYIAFYHNGSGNSLTNIMIRPAVITDPTFVPYAKTNRELTVENDSQQSEINYAVNTGVKNLLMDQALNTASGTGVTITPNGDGTYTLSGTPTGTATYLYTPSSIFTDLYGLETGNEYTISAGSNKVLIRVDYSVTGTTWENTPLVNNLPESANFTLPHTAVGIYIRFRSTAAAGSLNGTVLKPMIRTTLITDSTFQPYSKTNRELTVAEDEDRAALVKQVDEGAKNLLDFEKWANAVDVVRGTKSVQGDAITITATEASCNTYWASADFPVDSRIPVTPGEKVVLSWKTDNTSGIEKGQVYVFGNGSASNMVYTSDISEILEYIIPSGVSYITWRVGVNAAGDSIKYSKLMLCTATDYAISPAFATYALQNPVLTPALIEQVDDGAKNRFLSDKVVGTTETIHGRTFTIQTDGGVKIETTGTVDADADFYILGNWSNRSTLFDTGSKTWIPVCSCTTKSANISLRIYNRSTGSTVASRTTTSNDNAGISFDFDLTCAFIKIGSAQTIPSGGIVVYPMICTSADYAVSHTSVPYALPNPALTSALIEQINEGAKNFLNLNTDFTTSTSKGITYKNNKDGTINVSGTSSAGDSYINLYDRNTDNLFGIQKGETVVIRSTSDDVSINLIYKKSNGNYGLTVYGYKSSPGWFTVPSDFVGFLLRIGVPRNGTTVNEDVGGMICTAAGYAVSPEVVSYALPNPILTPAVVKAVDEGAKNLLRNTAASQTISGVTFTVNEDGTVDVEGTNTGSSGITFFIDNVSSAASYIAPGHYVLSGCNGGSNTTYELRFYRNDGGRIFSNYDGKSEFDYTSGAWNVSIIIRTGQTVNTTFKPMICAVSDYAISPKFVPYAPTNRELYGGELQYEMVDIVDNLNATFVDKTNSRFNIHKYGRFCFADVSLKLNTNNLTGNDTITSTALPEKMRPKFDFYGVAVARDNGTWALANMLSVPFIVGATNGSVLLRTGAGHSSALYITATMVWCASNT